MADDGLAAEVELLAAENRRLKREAAARRQSHYRKTALRLGALGLLAGAGAAAFPESRTVLAALAGIGLFGAVLSYLVVPERFVSARTSERVYAAYAASAGEMTADLGLGGDPVYAPAKTDGFADVRLYVPTRNGAALPATAALEDPFVVADEPDARGVTFTPVGAPLLAELREVALEPIPTEPAALGEYLAGALVDAFELAGDAHASADAGGESLTVAVVESAYGPVDRFDHPVVSLLATSVAAVLDVPVRVAVERPTDREEWLVTLNWASETAEPTAEPDRVGAVA